MEVLTRTDASDSVGCVTTTSLEADRLPRVRWCACGQPWLPAVGLYGTTEETACQACVLRRGLAEERNGHAGGPTVAKARAAKVTAAAAFIAAIEECEVYSKAATSEEAKAVALNIATRIQRRAKQ